MILPVIHLALQSPTRRMRTNGAPCLTRKVRPSRHTMQTMAASLRKMPRRATPRTNPGVHDFHTRPVNGTSSFLSSYIGACRHPANNGEQQSENAQAVSPGHRLAEIPINSRHVTAGPADWWKRNVRRMGMVKITGMRTELPLFRCRQQDLRAEHRLFPQRCRLVSRGP